MRLEFGVAVAVAGSCSSDSTPILGTSIRCGCSPKKTKKKKKSGLKISQIFDLGQISLMFRIISIP